MKFTSEDLMKAMGLQVGDRIKVTFEFIDEQIFEITESAQGTIYLQAINDFYSQAGLGDLINQDFGILPRPKRVGDLKCDAFDDCRKCPLRTICETICFRDDDITLYKILELYKEHGDRTFDQEIYDLFKARLDKEVEE